VSFSRSAALWVNHIPRLGWVDRDGFVHADPSLLEIAKDCDRILEEPTTFSVTVTDPIRILPSSLLKKIEYIQQQKMASFLTPLMIWLHLLGLSPQQMSMSKDSAILPLETWWELHSPSPKILDPTPLFLCGYLHQGFSEFLRGLRTLSPQEWDFEVLHSNLDRSQVVVVDRQG